MPWLEVIYSPPNKSSLKHKNDASHIGIVFLSYVVRVSIPCAACTLAIKSKNLSELYLTSLPASLISFLPLYFSLATNAFAYVASIIPIIFIGKRTSYGYKIFCGPLIPAVETAASFS